MQSCIACQTTTPIDNFPASFMSYTGYGIICFDCIKVNAYIEICHDVCRRCHMSGAMTFSDGNGRCNRCAHTGKKIMARFNNGELTVNETIAIYPYTRLAQASFTESIKSVKSGEIMSIDQEIIDSMCV